MFIMTFGKVNHVRLTYKLNGRVSVILQYTPVLNGRHFKDDSSDLLDKHL